jgi:hypothetical protein
VRAAYQHVAYLGEDTDAAGQRTLAVRFVRFDKDNHTSLDGNIVWADLDDKDKAFEPNTFDAKALLNNLRDNDWGLPLKEIRDAFYKTPRLPLLPGGDADLRNAIYDAYANGKLKLTNAAGQEASASRPADINVGSDGLRLAKPTPAGAVIVPNLIGKSYIEAKAACDAAGLVAAGSGKGTVTAQDPAPDYEAAPGATITISTTSAGKSGGGGGGSTGGSATSEVQLAVTLRISLTDRDTRDNARLLFDALGDAADDSATHLEATLKIVVPSSDADEIRSRAVELGAHISETEF